MLSLILCLPLFGDMFGKSGGGDMPGNTSGGDW